MRILAGIFAIILTIAWAWGLFISWGMGLLYFAIALIIPPYSMFLGVVAMFNYFF